MKTSIVISILFWTILAGTSQAAIYQYTDENGEVHYTNELSSIPADKLDQVTETEETESKPEPPVSGYTGPIYPLLRNSPSPAAQARAREKAQQKAALEAEYEALLKEKEALDNDESFQTRRYKRKYQNRPYIQELIAKEARINQRLTELEQLLKKYGP